MLWHCSTQQLTCEFEHTQCQGKMLLGFLCSYRQMMRLTVLTLTIVHLRFISLQPTLIIGAAILGTTTYHSLGVDQCRYWVILLVDLHNLFNLKSKVKPNNTHNLIAKTDRTQTMQLFCPMTEFKKSKCYFCRIYTIYLFS
jgi:hypothetical protein